MSECMTAALRDLLLHMTTLRVSHETLTEVIQSVKECSEGTESVEEQVTARLVEEPEISCFDRMERVKQSIPAMKQLIREGAPKELYERLNQTYRDIGKCATPEFIKSTDSIFSEIRVVTQDVYYKGQGVILNRKLDELTKQFDIACLESGCALPKPRPVPLTVGERLVKIGLALK